MKRIVFLGEQCKKDVTIADNPQMPQKTCTGCKLCELVCSLKHFGSSNSSRSRIHTVKIEPLLYEPITCKQCEFPVCMEICSTGALKTDQSSGILFADDEKCNGCGLCVLTCPIGAITIDPKKKKALVCDMCGGDPSCVKYCPTKVLKLEEDQFQRQEESLSRKGWRGSKLHNLIAQKKRQNHLRSKYSHNYNELTAGGGKP